MKKSKVIKLLVLILTFLVSVCFAVGCNNTPSGGNDSSKKEGTPAKYFTFILLEDGTYEVKAKNVNNIPAEIVIPSTYSGKAVTSIGWGAFVGCDSLTSVEIGDSVTSIGDGAFEGCDSLTSVEIPNSVISIGWAAFSNCSSLISIIVSEDNANYKDIDGNLYTKDGKTLLQYAIGKKDTSFTIPNGVETIALFAFYSCDSLKSVIIGDSVTSIGYKAFAYCLRLTSVEIGDSVTSIGENAFSNCYNLTSVEIPNSVISIGWAAFSDCSSLTKVYYKGSSTEWGNITIGSYNEYLTNATRYYYSESEPTEEGNFWHYKNGARVEW